MYKKAMPYSPTKPSNISPPVIREPKTDLFETKIKFSIEGAEEATKELKRLVSLLTEANELIAALNQSQFKIDTK